MKSIINFCFILFVSIIVSCNSENESENIIENNNQNRQKYETLKLNLKNYSENETKLEECIKENTNCFSIKYPIQMLMPDVFNNINKTIEITVKNDDDFFLPFLFNGSNSIVYPITIIDKEDGKEIEVKDATDFDKHRNECKKEAETCNEKRNCFRFSYPLRLVKDSGVIKTVNDNDELNNFINNLEQTELFKLTYPLSLYIVKDSSQKNIENTEELNSLFSNCVN